ncbi:MAG: hypothetical protein ABUS48_03350 [Pseudomonadota bacterium]
MKNALFFVVGFVWLAYGLWIYTVSPQAPNPSTGQVWPFPYHGSTAYLSWWAYLPVIAPPLIGGLIALRAVMLRRRK